MDTIAESLQQVTRYATALAYTGAGADLGLISSAIALVFTLGSSLFFIVLWPVRKFWRKLTGRDSHDVAATDLSDEAHELSPQAAASHDRKAA
jgi:hypothetical protein